jgi:diadenylate cyclase
MTPLLGRYAFLAPGPKDLIQIALVAVGGYYVLRLLARTRALQMLSGLLVLGALYVLARVFDLALIRYILEQVFKYGVFAAIIIFQPELRTGLARLGQRRFLRAFSRLQESDVADEIVEACERLARANMGAIIAVERQVGLEEYAETGTRLQARVAADILVSIFLPYGPLHDGAVLIAGDTIMAAGVILPLTQFPVADKSLGTRHRAALGLSEETDALVIVVSEETSRISLAGRGSLEQGVSAERLREALQGSASVPAPA